MVKETYWRDLGFYHCRNKLSKNWYKFGIINGLNTVSKLIQVDDTDFPRFSKNEKGMNLDTMHNWITGNDKKRGKPALAGTVDISKEKLLMALKMCSRYSKKEKFDVKRKTKRNHNQNKSKTKRKKKTRKNKSRKKKSNYFKNLFR